MIQSEEILQHGVTCMFLLFFNVEFGKWCVNLSVLIALSPHLPHCTSKLKSKTREVMNAFYPQCDTSVLWPPQPGGHQAEVLEQKSLLLCSPASTSGEHMKEGTHITGGISRGCRWLHPGEAIPVWPTPGACRVESLAHHYMSKQWLKLLLRSWHRMKMSLSAPWERLFGLDLLGKARASACGVAPARLPHGAAMFMANTGRAGRTESFVVAPCPPHVVPSPRALQCIAAGQVQQQLHEFLGKKYTERGEDHDLFCDVFGVFCLLLFFVSAFDLAAKPLK